MKIQFDEKQLHCNAKNSTPAIPVVHVQEFESFEYRIPDTVISAIYDAQNDYL